MEKRLKTVQFARGKKKIIHTHTAPHSLRVALVTQGRGSSSRRWTHVQCRWDLSLVSVFTGLRSPESPTD